MNKLKSIIYVWIAIAILTLILYIGFWFSANIWFTGNYNNDWNWSFGETIFFGFIMMSLFIGVISSFTVIFDKTKEKQNSRNV